MTWASGGGGWSYCRRVRPPLVGFTQNALPTRSGWICYSVFRKAAFSAKSFASAVRPCSAAILDR